jgi:3-phenylpropionate/cinnamic acid dioxygenase small subunit
MSIEQPTAAPAIYGFATPEYAEIHDWISLEAHLLDEARYDEWLELIHPTVEYSMPVRLSLMPKDGMGFSDDMDYYADDFVSLKTRVDRLKTEQAWAEQPGSRTRHLLTNPLITDHGDGEFFVKAQFLVTRARADQPADIFSGDRHDILTRGEGGRLQVRHRRILLDQSVLKSFNLSILF